MVGKQRDKMVKGANREISDIRSRTGRVNLGKLLVPEWGNRFLGFGKAEGFAALQMLEDIRWILGEGIFWMSVVRK